MNELLHIEANGHTIQALPFRRSLIAWGRDHFRPFPWRLTPDPYRILVAEVMLHRTQATQVIPVYERLIALYPSLNAITTASREELHTILHPLGLQWRNDLISEMLHELATRFNHHIPRDKAALLSLPGVSDYIAGAVRCFAWNLPDPVIDTNVVRVMARLFNLQVKDSSRRSSQFRILSASMLDQTEPRAYTYALLDMADAICAAKRPPSCGECPLLSMCAYGQRHN